MNRNFEGPSFEREIERILPELMNSLHGNGGLRLDTDTLSVARDYETLQWLSRIVAGFVYRERQNWKPNFDDLMKEVRYQKERMQELDSLLRTLTTISQRDGVAVEDLKTFIDAYRDESAFFHAANYGRFPRAKHFHPDRDPNEPDALEQWKQQLEKRESEAEDTEKAAEEKSSE